jgi:hypothetical protein
MIMKRIVLLAILLTAGAADMARADTFVWTDPKYGYTMSFPDSWRMQTQDNPTTQMRVAGPIGEDLATCKMEVRKDGRTLIYPKRLVDEAVMDKLGRDFWDRYTGELINPQISDYYAPASLGDKGDGTAIRVGFLQNDGKGTQVPMTGIMIASLYGPDLYVASCSSRYEMYGRYAALFGSILDSITLEKTYHPFATGYYRNFLMDPKLVLPRSKPGTVKEGAPYRAHWWSMPDKYHYN